MVKNIKNTNKSILTGKKPLYSNFLCLLAVALFSVSFPAVEILRHSWEIFSLLSFRNFLALITMTLLWISIEKSEKIKIQTWLAGLFIGGVGFGLGSTLIVLCQILTTPIIAALAASMMPISGIFLEILLDKRKISLEFILGLSLVLIGGVIATGIELKDTQFGFGLLLGLLASMTFAWGSRQTVKTLSSTSLLGQATITTAGMFALSLIIVCFSKLVHDFSVFPKYLDLNTWALLIFYSCFSLALSQVIWIKGVSLIGIGIASFHLNAAPFYVMVILVFLGFEWSWLKALGGLIIVTGIIISQTTTSIKN
tara:strand:+ start:7853 stop:8785 length:933 start_codon:yes stop_codon:yes gene_type:complete